jgi:hypothetical protein
MIAMGVFGLPNEAEESNTHTNTNNNKNLVRVNNNFNLTINFGDSLNLVALIAGIYVIRRISKKNKTKKTKM